MSAPFRHPHRVTYADCTVGNHVYYGRYLELLEAARGEFFRHLGTSLREWQEREVIFPVLECHLHYRAMARYDEQLLIEVRPTLAQRVRLNFVHRIVGPGDRVILEAETHHLCAGLNEKPRRLPEALLAALAPFLGAA